MGTDQIIYQTGIPEEYRSAAVDLYDEAFAEKLSLAIISKEDRKRVFYGGLALNHAIGAISPKGLLGIAGFHATEGSLTGGICYRDLVSHLGIWKGTRAAAVFGIYERKPKAKELVMDGIAVRPDSQGMGIGSTLLNEIRKYAIQQGYHRVRLDVIDTNPKARKLYERSGFKEVKTETFPCLKHLLGFGGVTKMELGLQGNI